MSHAIRLTLPLLLVLAPACVFVVSDDGIEWAGHGYGERGSGVRIEEERPVSEFHTVRLAVPGEVEVRVGEASSLHVSGDDNVVPRITTDVRNGVLYIELDGSWRTRREIELVLTTPTLAGFTIEGSGDVRILGLTAPRLELAIEGSGTVRASGRVEELHGSIDGSGELALAELEAGNAELSIEGSGSISVRAANGLHYSIEGSGSIFQAGAADPHGTVEGSGSVSRRQ